MASKNPKRVIWDACVIIAYIQDSDGWTARLQPFVDEAEAGKFEILIPEPCVTEVLTLRRLLNEGADVEPLRELFVEFLNAPFVVRVPLHAELAEAAGELATIAPKKIRGVPDAVLLALAVREQIPVHTFDGENSPGPLKLDGMIGDPPVRIQIPNWGQDTLFEGLS